MKKISSYYPIIIIGIISIIFCMLLHASGIFGIIETKLYDLRFQIKGQNKIFNSNVVLLEIDDESFRLIPESYPYPRGKIWSKVIRNLSKAGAKVIAFDIQFDSKDPTTQTIVNNINEDCTNCSFIDGDDELFNAIKFATKNNTKVVLASKIGYEQSRIPPYYIVKPIKSVLNAKPYIGLVDHEVDEIDNVSRRYTVFNALKDNNKKYFSFGLQSAMCYLDIDSNAVIVQDIENNKIIIDKLTIQPFRKEAAFLINYYGPVSNVHQTFPVYSVSQVVDDSSYDLKLIEEDTDWIDMYIDTTHYLYNRFGKSKSPFNNKIVVIGSSLKEDQDFKETPFFSFLGTENPMPGLEFHANAIQQLIDGKYINVPTQTLDLTSQSFYYHLLIITIISLLILLISTKFEIIFSMFFTIIFICSWFSFSMGLFIGDQFWILKLLRHFFNNDYIINFYSNHNNILLPVFFPMASAFLTYGINLSYKLILEQKDKRFLKDTFGLYISPDLIDEMYNSKEIPKLGGESGICTAFFSDIEGFSTISGQLSASQLVNLLNEFLSEQTEILIQHNGTLDKYEGDAILAFFGAPVKYKDHAKQALDTAVDLHENLKSLKKRWESEGDKWPKIVHTMNMRIGINTGEMVTGNMGSEHHMNYTMMGDVVNVAARLESGAKHYGIYFHTTYNTLKAAGINRYAWRYIDKVKFKGLTKWHQTIEILNYKEKIDDKTKKLIESFQKGQAAFYKRKWDVALKCFNESKKNETISHNKDLNPSTVFIDRINKFIV